MHQCYFEVCVFFLVQTYRQRAPRGLKQKPRRWRMVGEKESEKVLCLAWPYLHYLFHVHFVVVLWYLLFLACVFTLWLVSPDGHNMSKASSLWTLSANSHRKWHTHAHEHAHARKHTHKEICTHNTCTHTQNAHSNKCRHTYAHTIYIDAQIFKLDIHLIL
jgi:hypothetical protein